MFLPTRKKCVLLAASRVSEISPWWFQSRFLYCYGFFDGTSDDAPDCLIAHTEVGGQ